MILLMYVLSISLVTCGRIGLDVPLGDLTFCLFCCADWGFNRDKNK